METQKGINSLNIPAPAKRIFELFEQKILSQTQKMVEIETELFQFELFYATISPEKRRNELAKKVSAFREQEWKKALKEAKGDATQAMEIYSKSYKDITF